MNVGKYHGLFCASSAQNSLGNILCRLLKCARVQYWIKINFKSVHQKKIFWRLYRELWKHKLNLKVQLFTLGYCDSICSRFDAFQLPETTCSCVELTMLCSQKLYEVKVDSKNQELGHDLGLNVVHSWVTCMCPMTWKAETLREASRDLRPLTWKTRVLNIRYVYWDFGGPDHDAKVKRGTLYMFTILVLKKLFGPLITGGHKTYSSSPFTYTVLLTLELWEVPYNKYTS